MKEERPGRARRVRRANGDALRYYRDEAAHLTLHELEDLSGISYTTISRIENGRIVEPRWGTLKRLAAALEIDVDELVTFVEVDGDPVPDEPGLTKENERRLDEVRQERRERAEREGNSQDDTGDRST